MSACKYGNIQIKPLNSSLASEKTVNILTKIILGRDTSKMDDTDRNSVTKSVFLPARLSAAFIQRFHSTKQNENTVSFGTFQSSGDTKILNSYS